MNESELLERLGAVTKLIIPGPGKLSSFDLTNRNIGEIIVSRDGVTVLKWFMDRREFRHRHYLEHVFMNELKIIAPYGSEITVAINKNLSGEWEPGCSKVWSI